jgi:hypothetical protein
LREHNDVLREIARERRVPLLDLAALLADDALYVDQKHLSERGNDLKADAIFRFLVDGGLLPRARRPA